MATGDVNRPYVKGSSGWLPDVDGVIQEGHYRSGSVPASALGGGLGALIQGRQTPLFVDTVNGVSGGDGGSWAEAFTTIADALAVVADHGCIYILGDIREQVTAPLGVQGVKVISVAGGNTRHDDGTRWREAAVAGDAPLITVREQGWEFHNILFVPQATYSGVRFRRQEDATYPDGSHGIVRGCKFIGVSNAGIGIEDYGGMHHAIIEDNEFMDLASGIEVTNQGIAIPLRNVFRRNFFSNNTHHFRGAQSQSMIKNNVFTPAGTVTTVINTAYGNTGLNNMVVDNWFAAATADIDPGNGYTGNATDVWRNFSSDTAAMSVGQPA